MRYLCAVYLEPKNMEMLSPAEGSALDRDSIAYDEELRRSGHYIASDALQHVTAARTVRVRNGKLSVIDGPFAETKEQLGGFILVEARDLDEAVELASRIPMAKHGTIEVRPVMEISAKGPSMTDNLPLRTRRVRAVVTRWSASETM